MENTERSDLTVVTTRPAPAPASERPAAFKPLSIGNEPKQTEPAHKRLVTTLEAAKELKLLARDIGTLLAGSNPGEPTTQIRRSDQKGFFAGLDAQASEIERELESARVALENIKRLI